MSYGLYAIRDVKTGFMTPTIEASDDAAARNFTHSIVNSDTILFSFAQDFSLYRIGTYDSDSALVTPLTPIQLIIEGSTAARYNGGAVHAD
ncbi:nonstructural protein [Peromfec virus RodF8_30]|uniref:Nonstructural protein n=1 Tax=Peromfec virus RodF8_30 TaxID=2929368 RepID=A0A976N2I0_9VIRU|nr:nonstructural protein [Peromfec virus RodF8_30]